MKGNMAELVSSVVEEIRKDLSKINKSLLHIGAMLSWLREEKHYRFFEHNWADFLNSYTCLSPYQASVLISIWEKFHEVVSAVDSLEFPFDRLKEAYKLVQNTEQAEDWLHKAKTLPYRAWRDALREAKGLMPTDQCDHEDCEIWERCKKCGKFHKVAEKEG